MRLGFTPRSFRRPRLVNIAAGLTTAGLVVGFVASVLLEPTSVTNAANGARWLFANQFVLLLFVASLFVWLFAGIETIARRRHQQRRR